MEIEISGYKIKHEGLCVTLYKAKKSEKVGWSIIGQYPRLSQCLDRLIDEKLADSDAKSIDDLRSDLVQISSCVRTRTGVDNRRKELGADARKWINDVNQAAKDLLAPLEKAEDHLRVELQTEDSREAAIKAEAERKEQARINEIKEEIYYIESLSNHTRLRAILWDSERLKSELEQLDKMDISEDVFQEFTQAATVELEHVKDALQDALAAQLKYEEQQEADRIERERLEKLRAEQRIEEERHLSMGFNF